EPRFITCARASVWAVLRRESLAHWQVAAANAIAPSVFIIIEVFSGEGIEQQLTIGVGSPAARPRFNAVHAAVHAINRISRNANGAKFYPCVVSSEAGLISRQRTRITRVNH